MNSKSGMTARQLKYVELRLAGKNRLEAAKECGYSNPSQQSIRFEANAKIIAALSCNKAELLPVEVVREPVVARKIFPPIVKVEKLTCDELKSALANIVRDESQPVPARVLAAKLVSDLEGWLDPSKRQGDVFVNFGDTEKNL